jgi:hypothetical protein
VTTDRLTEAGQRLHIGERREPWWRGPAVVEGDWIVLDRERMEPYKPMLFDVLRPGENLLTELAIVRRPRDAVAFARSFGLLYAPPDDGPWRESFRVWEQQARLLRIGLTLYADVQATMADRAPERMRTLREAWSPLLAPGRPDLDFAAMTDVAVFSQAANAVVSIVNEGIGEASERTAVMVDEKRGPLWFMAEPQTPDLLTFVYLQLQTLVTGMVPLRTCADPECGRSFTPDDPRARYCQPAHGNRTRARRSRRRLTAGEGGRLAGRPTEGSKP